MIVLIILLIVKSLLFILEAIGIFKLAKKKEIKLPVLCFVPFITPYYLGLVAEKKKNLKVWLIILFFLTLLTTAVLAVFGFISANEIIQNAKICIVSDTKMTLDMFSSAIYPIIFYFVSLFAAISYKILRLAAFWKIVSKENPKKTGLYMILSAVLYPLMPIFILINS
ncbi:MAG: hypothetical protein IJP34_03925 [Clostridia bacterium]|nr:hypothetical protein [Clostridia bacterium]